MEIRQILKNFAADSTELLRAKLCVSSAQCLQNVRTMSAERLYCVCRMPMFCTWIRCMIYTVYPQPFVDLAKQLCTHAKQRKIPNNAQVANCSHKDQQFPSHQS